MYEGRRVCVVVPAYNEEKLIGSTVRGIPEFVDSIVVVDDCSSDCTAELVRAISAGSPRVHLIARQRNGGVGAAISDGYVWARDNGMDIAVVMAGDGQMDPADLPSLLDPVVQDRTDYAKGNRLISGEAWRKVPRLRYLGNSALTFLTKIASGYWHVTDSQTGYTAVNRRILDAVPLEEIYPRYGMPNDFLVTLNIYNMRVMDVPVRPVYGIGETSGIRLGRMLFSMPVLLGRLFLRRMVRKYIIRDFHPLVLFYLFGLLLLAVDAGFLVRFFVIWARQGSVPPITALAVIFCTFMGFQSLLFAMLFDMEANRDLKGIHGPGAGSSTRGR
ncbi:glycosyltransferase family 2 protein [Candidatus Fermentibacterales bacterium]|nr:glycosyltransferase family 2 protein [Candidatus Fermentibacterales bacterium]